MPIFSNRKKVVYDVLLKILKSGKCCKALPLCNNIRQGRGINNFVHCLPLLLPSVSYVHLRLRTLVPHIV